MKKTCGVDDLHYVASASNPADLATRGGVKLGDIGPSSFWQLGPTFLPWWRDLWPASRDFISEDVPEEEIRTRKSFSFHLRVIVTNVATATADVQSTVQLWTAVEKILQYSNDFEKVRRILARMIKGWSFKASKAPLTAATLGEPIASELEKAERLMLVSAMPLTAVALYEKKLVSLCPKKDGCVTVTTGRFGEKSLSRLLGVSSLPILMPSSRTAYLYMVRAHEGQHKTEHKSIVETLARSRQSVWIVRGRMLAKKVCDSCYTFKRMKIKLSGQLMANIKEETTTGAWSTSCPVAIKRHESCPVAIKRHESCPVAKYKRNRSCPVATPLEWDITSSPGCSGRRPATPSSLIYYATPSQ